MGSEGTGLTVMIFVLTFITCRTCFLLMRRPGPRPHTCFSRAVARVCPPCRASGDASQNRLHAEAPETWPLTHTSHYTDCGAVFTLRGLVVSAHHRFKHYSRLHYMVLSVRLLRDSARPTRPVSSSLLVTAAAGGTSGCLLPSRSFGQKLPDNTVSLKIKFKKLCFVVFSDIHMHIRFRCSYKRKDGF